MKADCVKLAEAVLFLTKEAEATPGEQYSALILALAMLMTSSKLDSVAVGQIKYAVARDFDLAADFFHQAREAQAPSR